jgi:hypothetical protein
MVKKLLPQRPRGCALLLAAGAPLHALALGFESREALSAIVEEVFVETLTACYR